MRAAPRDCAVSIPDTLAAVPSSWRSRRPRPFTNRTRRAREPRRLAAPPRPLAYETFTTFMIAPVGTTPVVTYRHNAMTSLRATATIPIRRARFPFPKRA